MKLRKALVEYLAHADMQEVVDIFHEIAGSIGHFDIIYLSAKEVKEEIDVKSLRVV